MAWGGSLLSKLGKAMPGRLYATHERKRFEAFAGVAFPEDAELPKIEISPGESWPVLIVQDGELCFRTMRWSMIMSGRTNARGRPVMETIVNARSETVFDKSAFEGVRRGILLASGWYEWTGQKRKKTRWRLYSGADEILAIAAIWDVWSGPGGVELAQCAAVTCEPNADVRAYHHRMPLLVDRDLISDWLSGDLAQAQAMIGVPAPGTITVDAATDVQDIIGH